MIAKAVQFGLLLVMGSAFIFLLADQISRNTDGSIIPYIVGVFLALFWMIVLAIRLSDYDKPKQK